MTAVPLWLFVGSLAVAAFIFFVLGVVMCYRKTPRIGDIIMTRDDEGLYLFLELNKPLEEYENRLADGKEVLATIRVKNRS